MKKCCFLIPYFGKFPSYFQLFLNTCSYNKRFEWIIFTDNKEEYNYPSNVKKVNITFSQMKDLVNEKFGFEVALLKPYKLCDLKPAYGYIFESYITEYEFWGHCDVDTLMGDLDKFITAELLDKYEKLFCLGHMILYRNTYENNRVFMSEINEECLYKKSFQNEKITWFDETFAGNNNVDTIFLYNKKAVLREDWSINFRVLPTKFVRTKFDATTNDFIIEDYREAVYVWDDGKIYRYYKNNEELIKEEFMYMHLQSRNMKVSPNIIGEKIFKIIPNEFRLLEVNEITSKNFESIKKKKINFHYFQVQYKRKKTRIKNILKKLW